MFSLKVNTFEGLGRRGGWVPTPLLYITDCPVSGRPSNFKEENPVYSWELLESHPTGDLGEALSPRKAAFQETTALNTH